MGGWKDRSVFGFMTEDRSGIVFSSDIGYTERWGSLRAAPSSFRIRRENGNRSFDPVSVPQSPAMIIREYAQNDLDALIGIWNEVVEEGVAFPQEEYLTPESGTAFFGSQSFTGVAEEDGRVLGLYILHPNNVGRCGHICNASYAVASAFRGRHIGEKLVLHSLKKGKELGFQILQFNAVVENNTRARRLYERLGFVRLGTIPAGFRMKDGRFENICPYYHIL